MRAIDGFTYTDFSAGPGTFNLSGGNYGVTVTAGTWGSGGTISLEINDPNGTPVKVLSGTVNTRGTVSVPPCSGTVAVSGTVTGGNILVTRIPGE